MFYSSQTTRPGQPAPQTERPVEPSSLRAAPPELGRLPVPRRAWALGLSVPLYAGLGAGLWALAKRPPEGPVRLPTLAVSLEEGPSLPMAPPPPPPPGVGTAGPARPAPLQPDLPEASPALVLPTEPLPEPAPAAPLPGVPGGGVPGGQPGGQVGGTLSGTVGGVPGGQVGGLVPPRFDAAYLNNPAPDYPPQSRRLREQGRVVLRVLVGAGGAPERVEIRSGSGHPRLDQAALQAVRRWRFLPARQGAEPVPAWVLVPIAFDLDG